MACEKDWIDISTALLTPVIAIAGVGLGILQWRINRARLQHELFDRRYEIFEATKEFLVAVITEAKMKHEDRIKFLKGTKGAFALYSKSIVEYLDKVHKQSLALHLHAQKGNNEAEHEILVWFGEQIEKVDEIFKRELKVGGCG